MGKSARCAHRLVTEGQVSRALSRRTHSSIKYSHSERKGGKKNDVYPNTHGRHGRKRQSFFPPPYSQQPFALPQLSPYTHSRHNTAARKKGQLVPPHVPHLLSLSRVSPVSVRSKQLPALGPSYGRKERTQALSHSARMRTHCRRVTKTKVKGG